MEEDSTAVELAFDSHMFLGLCCTGKNSNYSKIIIFILFLAVNSMHI